MQVDSASIAALAERLLEPAWAADPRYALAPHASPFEPIEAVWAHGSTFAPSVTGEIVLGLPETDGEILACARCGRVTRVSSPPRFGLVAGLWCSEHGPCCGGCALERGAWSNDDSCCMYREVVVDRDHRPDP